MSDLIVRRLVAGDDDAFVSLRQESLKQSPWAFGSSPEVDMSRDPQMVAALLSPDPERAAFGAYSPELVGMVGYHWPKNRPKLIHAINVFGMYVAPSARGEGVGSALLEAMIAHVRETLPAVKVINLQVTDAATDARKLYERVGFQTWGKQPRALEIDGVEYAEYHMALALDRD